MTLDLFLPIADHGDIVSTLPFFLPAILIVGGLLCDAVGGAQAP